MAGRGLRGSILEDMVNMTNSSYREKGLALIQKVPTPITPIEFDKSSGHITLAYFEQKSTVDYIGVVQGVPVCFDAKECHSDTFSLQNVHEHQYGFMRDFEAQGGIAFILLYFSQRDEKYYVPFCDLDFFYKRWENGGVRNFKYTEIDRTLEIKTAGGFLVHYLEQLQMDLKRHDG